MTPAVSHLKSAIIGWYRMGAKIEQIAREMNLYPGFVNNVIEEFKKENHEPGNKQVDRKRGGIVA